jgi:hypothetical protein
MREVMGGGYVADSGACAEDNEGAGAGHGVGIGF